MEKEATLPKLRSPRLKAPAGSCDTHMHFYRSSYPSAASATKSTPSDFWIDDYRSIQNRLGLDRVVIVQPTTYGLDNRCQLDAARAFGSSARVIVVVDETITDRELETFDSMGVRGVRFFMWSGGALGWESLLPVANRIADLGWHIQLHMNGLELPDRVPLLEKLPCRVSIDHIGRFVSPVGLDSAPFQTLLDLLGTGKWWVKLSAPNLHSRSGPPHYEDVGIIARELVTRFPERMLWATNTPHPGQLSPPDEADMLDLLLEWTNSDAVRRRILVDNPKILFGFTN